jgi:hypothetical protein
VTIGRAEAWEPGIVCPARPGYLALVAQQHDRRRITFRILDQIPLAG